MPRPRAFQSLFIAWSIALALLVFSLSLTLWNFSVLRERANLRSLLKAYREDITLGMLLDEAGTPPDERDQIRAAYNDPEIDLNQVSWNLRSRPMTFVGSAPDPGDQPDGPINRQQLRDERDVTLPRPPGVYRIFLTGGSFAYSVGCDIEHSIARLLERELNRRAQEATTRTFEVWNAAVPSWSSTHERIWITNHLAALEPDMIIMLTGTNECHWGHGGINVMDLRDYSVDEYFALINSARKIAGVAPYSQRPPWGEPPPVPPEVVAERFAANVRLAALAVSPAEVSVVVALQPSLASNSKILTGVERKWIEGETDAGRAVYMETCFSLLERSVRSLSDPRNLYVVSLRDVYSGRSDAIYLDMYHVGDKGNSIVANRLADEVMPLIERGR